MNERFIKQLTREVETRRADLVALEAALAVLESEIPVSVETTEVVVAVKPKPKYTRPNVESPCTLCGFVAVNAQGLGIHKRNRHGIRGKGKDSRPLTAAETQMATTQARRWEAPNTVDGETVTMA